MLNRTEIVAIFFIASLSAGCHSYGTPLPDITQLPDKLLSKEEQQKKAAAMAAKSQDRPADAAKEIEGTK